MGICIGMQIFFQKVKREKPGLGFFEGSIVKLNSSDKYKVPNVGFSEAKNIKIVEYLKILIKI